MTRLKRGCLILLLAFVGLIAFRCVAYRPPPLRIGDPFGGVFGGDLTLQLHNTSVDKLRVTAQSRDLNRNEQLAPNTAVQFGWRPLRPEWIWQGDRYVPVRVEAYDRSEQRVYCRIFEWDDLRVTPDVQIVAGALDC